MGCPLVHTVDYERLPSVKGLTHLSRLRLGRRSPFSVNHGSCGLCLHLVSQLQEPDQDPVLVILLPLESAAKQQQMVTASQPRSTEVPKLSWLGPLFPS